MSRLTLDMTRGGISTSFEMSHCALPTLGKAFSLTTQILAGHAPETVIHRLLDIQQSSTRTH